MKTYEGVVQFEEQDLKEFGAEGKEPGVYTVTVDDVNLCLRSRKPGPGILVAMQKVMKAVGHIAKEKRNQQQGFSFRGVDDVMNALHVPLNEAGVIITADIVDEKRSERTTQKGGVLFYTMLRVTYTFHALDGTSLQTTVVGEAMDSADKSTSKALSIAFKYAMLQVFSIPTVDQDDPDHDTHDVKGKDQKPSVDVDPIATAKPAPALPPPVKREVKNFAPKGPGLSPMQQVSAAISRLSHDRELVGQWIRAMYPNMQFPQMTQAVAEKIIQKLEDTPDEGLRMELRDQRSR